MSFKFDFAEGKDFVDSCCSEMFDAAHDVISESLTKDCPDLLADQPWEHLRGYLVACYSQMLENMIPQLNNELESFVEGDGGFISFAENTLNSDDAVEYAGTVTENLLAAPDILAQCQNDVDSIAELPAEASGDPDIMRDRLTEMFQKCITALEDHRIEYGNRIDAEADENAFVAPLASVSEILFGLIGAWYESLLASVEPFCEGATALGEARREKAKEYTEEVGQRVKAQAQDISYSVE